MRLFLSKKMKILSKINIKKHVKFILFFNVSLTFVKNFQIILTNNNNFFINIFKVKMFQYMYVHLELYNLYNE